MQGMKTDNLALRIEPDLREKIDRWREQQEIVPSRSAAIRHILSVWLREKCPEAEGRE